MKNVGLIRNSMNQNVKMPVYEHRSKGLIGPQVAQYTKDQYDKNKISLYEYKEASLLNPNSEILETPRYAGYEFPPVGLVVPNKTKSINESGYYEYPAYGQL